MLPWYAAGTLDRRDVERIERALAEDGELAQRYELVREELAETIRLNEMLGAPSGRAMDKLFAAIEAEEVRAPARKSRCAGGQAGGGRGLGEIAFLGSPSRLSIPGVR